MMWSQISILTKLLPDHLDNSILEVYDRSREQHGDAWKLSRPEAIDAIIKLTDERPFDIIVDALDEMPSVQLNELIKGFSEIMKNAKRPIKIFVSSRDDINTVSHQLKDAKNFHLSITAEDNQVDIERFVRQKIDTQLGDGALQQVEISDEFKEKVIKLLLDKAQGM